VTEGAELMKYPTTISRCSSTSKAVRKVYLYRLKSLNCQRRPTRQTRGAYFSIPNILAQAVVFLTSLIASLLPKRFVYNLVAQLTLVPRVSLHQKLPKTKYPSEWFTNSSPDEPVSIILSITFGVAVPLEKVQDALDLYIGLNDQETIPSDINIHYIKKTVATLGFNKFDGITAAIDLYGPDSRQYPNTGTNLLKFAALLEESAIPHSYHWVKLMPINDQWVVNCYGSSLDEWEAQRNGLLDAAGAEMFANDMMRSLGIHV
jgi:hypothetical protein